MKIRRDIVIAGLLGLVLAVSAHGGNGQTSIFDSGRSAPTSPAVSTSASHHKIGRHEAARPVRHRRHKHHRAAQG
jgi:hypothetical protein